MRFAGAPTWDGFGRQKVSANGDGASPRNGSENGGENGRAVMKAHVLSPVTTAISLPISPPNSDFLSAMKT
jgi:hypothetical protein